MILGFFDLPWWGYVLVTLALTHVTIASITIFLHRHQAHRALDLHPVPSHFFRFWLWLTSGIVTKEWAAIHRKHHAKCETSEDPHSPQTRGLRTVLLRGSELYRAEARNPETLSKYGHGTPDDWIERNLYQKHSVWGVALMLVIDVVLFGPIGITIWAVQMAWSPIWAAGVINGLGHFAGYRNYDCVDASTNLVPWGIFIGGEELHNNHHAFATSAKLSARWYEFDIGWMYIRSLALLRLATVKKTIPAPRFAAAKTVADSDTLQAIVVHRYDVMRRYMSTLKEVYREELAKLAQNDKRLDIKSMRRWLQSERSEGFPAKVQQQVEKVLGASPRLEQLDRMKRELAALWARSSASRDQLVQQLQDWCARAEASGIGQLQEFSLRLRRYAV